MKESYFTSDTIQTKAESMLGDVVELRRMHPYTFHPEKAVLLVLDMQDFFLAETSHAYIPSSSAIIPGLQQLIKASRKSRIPVFFSQHINSSNDPGQMVKWWKDLPVKGNPLLEIASEFDEFLPESVIIEKGQYDAFHGTSLQADLDVRGIEQLIVTGVMTHLCCETTARSAFVRGYDLFFAIDGTATYNEKFHRASIYSLSHGFAHPVLVRELLDLIGGGDAG